jgi:hypothetical protein
MTLLEEPGPLHLPKPWPLRAPGAKEAEMGLAATG